VSDAARKLLSEVANRAVNCKPLKGSNEASAKAAPISPLETFALPPLLRRQIEDAGGLKLVYIDPPFDFGADFR